MQSTNETDNFDPFTNYSLIPVCVVLRENVSPCLELLSLKILAISSDVFVKFWFIRETV